MSVRLRQKSATPPTTASPGSASRLSCFSIGELDIQPMPVLRAEYRVHPDPGLPAEYRVHPDPGLRAEYRVHPDPGLRAEYRVHPDPGLRAEYRVHPDPGLRAEYRVHPDPGLRAEYRVHPDPGLRTEYRVYPDPGLRAEYRVHPDPGPRSLSIAAGCSTICGRHLSASPLHRSESQQDSTSCCPNRTASWRPGSLSRIPDPSVCAPVLLPAPVPSSAGVLPLSPCRNPASVPSDSLSPWRYGSRGRCRSYGDIQYHSTGSGQLSLSQQPACMSPDAETTSRLAAPPPVVQHKSPKQAGSGTGLRGSWKNLLKQVGTWGGSPGKSRRGVRTTGEVTGHQSEVTGQPAAVRQGRHSAAVGTFRYSGSSFSSGYGSHEQDGTSADVDDAIYTLTETESVSSRGSTRPVSGMRLKMPTSWTSTELYQATSSIHVTEDGSQSDSDSVTRHRVMVHGGGGHGNSGLRTSAEYSLHSPQSQHTVQDYEAALASWLYELGLEKYTSSLLTAGYDMPTLSRATPEDLLAAGVSNPCDRRCLSLCLTRLRVWDGLPAVVPESLTSWLQLLRLDQYCDRLQRQGLVSLQQALLVDVEDLEDIGITRLGHQKRFLLGVRRVRELQSLQSGEPRSGELQSSALQSDELQSSELQSSALQSDELQSSELQSDELQSSELQSSELQSSELQSDELQSSELQSDELQSDELRSHELRCRNGTAGHVTTTIT